jgi:GNAT superfamily N-acetyltransferase
MNNMSEVIIRMGKENMDVALIHRFLSEYSYWAKGIPYTFVDNSLANSFCVGAFIDGKQIGFGRLITDYYTFAWFADFFVLPEYQGKGVAKKILAYIMEQPFSKRLRRKMLGTRDAHTLYQKFQFRELANPSIIMEINNPIIHLEYKEELVG